MSSDIFYLLLCFSQCPAKKFCSSYHIWATHSRLTHVEVFLWKILLSLSRCNISIPLLAGSSFFQRSLVDSQESLTLSSKGKASSATLGSKEIWWKLWNYTCFMFTFFSLLLSLSHDCVALLCWFCVDFVFFFVKLIPAAERGMTISRKQWMSPRRRDERGFFFFLERAILSVLCVVVVACTCVVRSKIAENQLNSCTYKSIRSLSSKASVCCCAKESIKSGAKANGRENERRWRKYFMDAC